ncbi:bifunctional 3-(3-hydroxy-phenyl)propionate/3-hydroxycinnamic acid hydroxylase [Micromonospora sp. WMMD882]|uniref:bifunctional 3-(3-hydroxy-phenyl)propionate/3-hydroxycinnamic acid hydroxylase MhpA n=1 Tax=Micromonospora sp. WMMD882 TaxID=3015151 RepID=UPI00248C3526|nr:bifunctional 3-(3-hydroxy-phenyl)propionate/3-hydroxycinnamic acid hydroxylase [Micromonospora sp. WMMD882]WBB80620.1 bifunctional 3-(3-hydroxy-phenyl)propionate/3-hydroxycinnamic acid hydroxylase [Micromonospora sp. WMMD882]
MADPRPTSSPARPPHPSSRPGRPGAPADAPLPVVVVGAGPTGVTAALLLAGHGVRSVVLDRFPGIFPQPRAVHLDDEVYRVLQRVGAHEGFAAVSRPGTGLRLLAPDHRVLAEFARGVAAGVHGHPEANMFDQPDLETLLRRRAAEEPLVTLRGGVEVTGVGQSADGPVRITLTDRDTGVRETLAARYLLGCDGANSTVRARVGVAMRDLGFAQRWLVVDVDTDATIDTWDGVHQVCDPRRAATYVRVGSRRHRWEFRLLAGETAAGMSEPETLARLVRPWTREVPFSALTVVRSAEYTFRAQVAERWRVGRVFLLGDAAHLTPPFVGQGLGSGLRDAANLTWKLAGVLGGGLSDDALDSYQTERLPHVTSLIRLAMMVGRSMTEGGEVGNLLRRVVVPRLAWLPMVLDSATPPLRRSALRRRRAAPWGLAGRLCPNAPLADGRRLDDLAGLCFVLVTARPVPPVVAAVARRRGVLPVTVARGSQLGRWLRRGRAGAALVRPDRTVLTSGDDLSALVAAAPVVPTAMDHSTPPS